jgi:hypothetical protein
MPLNDWTKHYPGVQRLMQQPGDVLLHATKENDREREGDARPRSQITAWSGMPMWRGAHGRLVHAARIVRSEQQNHWSVVEDGSARERGPVSITLTWQLEEGGQAVGVAFRAVHRFEVGDYLVVRDDGWWFTSDVETFEDLYTRMTARE